MTLTIKTNNHPRQLMSGLTLDMHVGEKKAAEIRQQFDYLNDEDFENEYFITTKVTHTLRVTLCGTMIILTANLQSGMGITLTLISAEFFSNM